MKNYRLMRLLLETLASWYMRSRGTSTPYVLVSRTYEAGYVMCWIELAEANDE